MMSRTMYGPSLVQQGSSLTLPSLLLHGANSFAGPDSILNYPTGLLSRTHHQQQDLTSRFMADRLPVPPPHPPPHHSHPGLAPFGMRPEMHHHQHLHQHMHQHLMPPQHPPGGGVSMSSSSIESAAAATAANGSPGNAFGSAAASSLLLGMAGYSTLGGGSSPLSGGLSGPRHGSSLALPLVGGPLGLPLTSGGLSGAFQPKNDVNSVPSLLMSAVQDRLSSASQSRAKVYWIVQVDYEAPAEAVKSGQWCTAHVRIAWEIHLHQQQQQQQQQIQSDVERSGSSNKGSESNRLTDHLLHLQSTGDGGSLSGHLESLYRLGLPMFGRSPYSARNTFSHLPYGGLGGTMHRFTGQPDLTSAAAAAAAGGFIGAASDWLRLSKSSPFPCPPPPWLRGGGAPEGMTDREGQREKDKDRERDRERERERVVNKEDEERTRCKVSTAQELIENNRDSVSRRSSGSTSRNERTRSRSPLRRPSRKASTSSRDDCASSPGCASSSSAHRPLSDRSESRDPDHRRHVHRARHTASTSPGTATTDPTAPPTPPQFPMGQIYPGGAACSDPSLFLPYFWTNPLDGDNLMRRLLGNVDEHPFLRADRLAHLDLMLGKIPTPFQPGGLGLGLNFRHLPSPGRLGKTTGLMATGALMPSRLPMGELSTSSPIYKVMGDGHLSEFR